MFERRNFDTSLTTLPATQQHIPRKKNLHLQQLYCKNFKISH